ncbi:MAG: hypothetical protein C5B43_00835 [Verrucomicrobia bacterium]|nr:MAG: hypothetical protein C5B43_00835 [Verrucomicrobiota bacterium]
MANADKNFFDIEENLFEKFCYLPQKLGCRVFNDYGATVINCGLQTSMFNIVCDARIQEENLFDSVQKIIEDFKGQPLAWWLGPSHTPRELSDVLH